MNSLNMPSPRVAVQSSSICSVGYSQNSETLEVEFAGGRVYRYFRVPAEVHRRFMEADSKGSFLNQFIKRRFDYERI